MSHALFGKHNIPPQKIKHALCLKFKHMWELYAVFDKPQQVFSVGAWSLPLRGGLTEGEPDAQKHRFNLMWAGFK